MHHRSEEHSVYRPDSGYRFNLSNRLRSMDTISYRHRWIVHNRIEEIHRADIWIVVMGHGSWALVDRH